MESIPSIGLGLWKISQDLAPAHVRYAIEVGYRHIDAAADYGNEPQAGEGIASALNDKVCRRDELWVTSKLWNTYHRAKHVRAACEKTLADLQLDYLDLYLIHFPISLAYVPFETRYPAGWLTDPSRPELGMKYDPVSISETWGAMEELVRAGLVRQIGVSNFGTSLLRDLLSNAVIRPSTLQVELHPYLTQEKLIRYCQSENIAVTGFSPFGASSYVSLGMADEADSVLSNPVVTSIARRHGKTPAQVVLCWGIQRGTSVVPKTSQADRLIENLAASLISLTTEEMNAISALDRKQRFNDPGVFCESAFHTYFPIFE